MFSLRRRAAAGVAAGAPLRAADPAVAPGAADPAPLLAATDLRKRYAVRAAPAGTFLEAVAGVSFSIASGRTLALVGESGSGKTTIGRLVARLERPDSGEIRFDGDDWLALTGRDLRVKRRNLQIVFQDPQTSLNPRMRIGDQVGEPLHVQGLATGRDLRERVRLLLAEVGLDEASASRFPSEFSGGQRQRIAIARALATRPKLVVCDEPVSALDASIAAQIVNLLLDLQERLALAYLFISHDLPLVGRVADRVAVVYLGRIVEEGPTAEVIAAPMHPYTAALVSSVPAPPGAPAPARIPIPGEHVPAARITEGCAFAPRCPIARPRCAEEAPPLAPVGPGRAAACFYPGELRLPGL
ncbi:MAG: oligopeptide/dipeptide ABC transporter ATP-binding protein [Acidobacteriota bacterium]